MGDTKNLRKIRQSRNMTQRELARETGIKPTTLNNYETGKRFPHEENLVNLASALNCTIDELLRGEA